MMNEDNIRQPIESIFSYEIKKDNKVLICWYDKIIKILSGDNAKKFLLKIENADEAEAQLIMAKLTTDIKRGKSGDTNTIVIRGSHYSRSKK